MIKFITGDILKADVEALVNTVNCVGVMGRGIALQFKKAYPENFAAYEAACNRGEVQIGKMLVHEIGMFAPRYIINFPTKRHWKGKSRLEDIKAGLPALVAEVRDRSIKSIAVPPLGCGLGGLSWDADQFLAVHSETRTRFQRVAKLIEGFETPYGMELLATVHWVASRESARDVQNAIALVHAWNQRKQMFPERHIRLAWNELISSGWLNESIH